MSMVPFFCVFEPTMEVHEERETMDLNLSADTRNAWILGVARGGYKPKKKLSVVNEGLKPGLTAAAMIKRNNKHKQRKHKFKVKKVDLVLPWAKRISVFTKKSLKQQANTYMVYSQHTKGGKDFLCSTWRNWRSHH